LRKGAHAALSGLRGRKSGYATVGMTLLLRGNGFSSAGSAAGP
jgi:hypothetical protein